MLTQVDTRTTGAAPEQVSATRPFLDAVFPVLVAIADDEASDAVIRVASALGRERGAVPTVLRVFAAGAVVSPDVLISMPRVEETLYSPEYRDEAVASLQATVREILGTGVSWRFDAVMGDIVECITEHAADNAAELVIMGLRHHSGLRRALVRDTVCQVIAGTRAPVLAVAPGADRLPSRAMVAVDFSDASLRAARLVRDILAASGTMELVYVHSAPPDVEPELSAKVRRALDRALGEIVADLEPGPDAVISRVVLEGNAATELFAHAERTGPDLVAVGRERRTTLDRLLNGSVTTAFAHDARWSLLSVPATR